MLQRRRLLRALAMPLLAAAAPVAAAEPLPAPSGPLILTVRGRIAVPGGVARFDRGLLLAGGTDELRTATPFTDGVSTFSGVLVSRLLDRLGADGTRAMTRALNDYAVSIPIEELRGYPVLLALDQDGRALSVRERGPLWVIYPFSEYPELDDRIHRQRSIWQLTDIEVA
jgi:hypothetical protein